MGRKQKITLSLDADLLKILRHHVVDREIQLSEFVEQCVNAQLLKNEKEVLKGLSCVSSSMRAYLERLKAKRK